MTARDVWLVERSGGGPGSSEVRACGQAIGGNLRVAVLSEERLGPYLPEIRAEALRTLVQRESAPSRDASTVVVLPHTYESAEYAPRLAVRLGAAYVPSVSGLTRNDRGELSFRRPVFRSKLQAVVRADRPVVVVTVQIGSFAGASVEPLNAPIVEVGRPADAGRVGEREILGREAAGTGAVDLASAERIVTAGRGVGGAAEVAVAARLAEALDAELGASRPVVDNGWLPRERQVGSSGHTVAPDLYVALGVSGSIQHLMGMSGSRVIVAVNKDRDAPIFSVANVGVVADLHDVVPVLTRLLEARRSR